MGQKKMMKMMKMTEIKELQEWAVKKAAMYDMKYARTNDARAWVNAQRYYLVIELCDMALGRAE